MNQRRPPKSPPPPPGLLVVDKPAGWTSHDVVGRARRLVGTRKVGHAGTLDPMATGVLVLGVERATKLLGHLALDTKTYLATIRLGVETSTDDAEGEPTATADASGVDDAAIAAGVAALTGDIAQVPSTVSAIKVDGRRAYERVRAGEEVTLAARPVHVARFDVLAIRREGPTVDLDVLVDCSSGTYVRALARDLGRGLGVGGHLTALRRTRVGPFTLEHARDLETLAAEADGEAGRAEPVARPRRRGGHRVPPPGGRRGRRRRPRPRPAAGRHRHRGHHRGVRARRARRGARRRRPGPGPPGPGARPGGVSRCARPATPTSRGTGRRSAAARARVMCSSRVAAAACSRASVSSGTGRRSGAARACVVCPSRVAAAACSPAPTSRGTARRSGAARACVVCPSSAARAGPTGAPHPSSGAGAATAVR